MKIDSVKFIPILFSPLIRLVDKHAAMSVAATSRIGSITYTFTNGCPILFALIKVEMVRHHLHRFVDVRSDMFAVHATQVSVGKGVPKMPDDGIDKEQMPVLIPVHAP